MHPTPNEKTRQKPGFRGFRDCLNSLESLLDPNVVALPKHTVGRRIRFGVETKIHIGRCFVRHVCDTRGYRCACLVEVIVNDQVMIELRVDALVVITEYD